MRGRDVPSQPDPKLPPTIFALDVAMLEGEPWQRQTYVAQNWQRLAALAWQGYQAWGRGMVKITVDPDIQDCAYIPLALARDYGLRKNAEAFMQEYSPLTEIIVGFHNTTPTPGNPGGELLIFQFQAGGTLETPPDAYRRLQQT